MCKDCGLPAHLDLRCRTILLVCSGGLTRRQLLKDLLCTGVRIVCYHREENWATDLVHGWITGPFDDNEAARSAIWRYCQEHPETKLEGVLCYDEFALGLAAHLAEHLGLPGIPYSVVAGVRDKHKFRQTCVAHGVAAPKFVHVSHTVDERVERMFEEHGMQFPVVVKPARGAGSSYVKKVHSMPELRQVCAWFAQDFESCRGVWGLGAGESGGMLVEEYIDGSEVDVDCVVERGKVLFGCVSDNRACEEPFFLEKGGRCPSALPQQQQVELLELLDSVVAMYGTQLSGCFHFEAKYSPKRGAVPIELNLRIGNAETYTNVLTAFGVNLIHEAARACLGMPMCPNHIHARPATPLTHLASVNFTPEWHGKGRLQGQHVEPFVTESPDFVGIHFYHQPGTVIVLPPEGFQSCGWMVAKGSGPEEAERNLVKLMKGVVFDLCAA